MNAVAHVYDGVAHTYDSDFFNLYERAHTGVIDQVRAYLGRMGANAEYCVGDALDLAGGTGQFWHRLQAHLNWSSLTLNDASVSMLSCARKKLPQGTMFIQGDSRNIVDRVASQSKDLVTSHFLFSFLDRKTVYRAANSLLKPGGLFSIATTTQRDLRALYTGRFEKTGKILRVERYLNRACTPRDHATLGQELEAFGFELVEQTHLTPPFEFLCFEDVRAWALESGWAASYFERFPKLKLALTTGALKIAEKLMHPLYPVVANSDMSLYLVRKPL